MSKHKHKHGSRPLVADHVLTVEHGDAPAEFLVAVVQESDDQVQVTGTEPGGIGCVWVHRDRLRKATKEDRAALGAAPADDAGEGEGDDQNRDAGGTGDAQA